MLVAFLRQSRLFRSLVLTTGIFSFLLWVYTSLRVIVDGIDPPEPFLPGFRSLSFLAVGVLSFGVAFLSMFVYLWLWGRFGERAPIPRGPAGP